MSDFSALTYFLRGEFPFFFGGVKVGGIVPIGAIRLALSTICLNFLCCLIFAVKASHLANEIAGDESALRHFSGCFFFLRVDIAHFDLGCGIATPNKTEMASPVLNTCSRSRRSEYLAFSQS
jgi:hypothetical protein